MLRYITSLLLIAASLVAKADAVTAVAGKLHELIANPAEVKDLVISGEINAADLSFIDSDLTALESLDLKDVKIVASSGSRVGISTNFHENSIPANIFAGSRISRIVLPEAEGLVIESGAFAGSHLKSVTIPAGIASVGDGAFLACPELTDVIIEADVLASNVFSDCQALESVTAGVAVAVPDGTFARCASLSRFEGSDKVTSIGAGAFAGCSKLETFDFGRDLISLGDRAFEGAGLTNVSLNEAVNLSEVGAWAFASMPELESLSLGKVRLMGEGVAFDCPKLRNFIAPEAGDVPDYAFAKNSVLEATGLIPVGATSVGAYAMSDLSEITDLTIPADVTYIGDRAMQRMTSLNHITAYPNEVPELGDEVWAGVDVSAVSVSAPVQLIPEYEATPQWKEFSFYDISSIEGVNADPSGDLPGIRARFVGNELQVCIEGVEIETIGLYNTAGILLAHLEPHEGYASVDTSDIAGSLFIVSATLIDGRHAAVKILR